MAAKDAISLEQLQGLLDYHGGTAFEHASKGGIQITLSQRLGQRWAVDNEHWIPSVDESHPIVAKVIEESKKEGLL